MAEPSKPIPSANAPSSSAGATDTDLRKPSTSVNQSRTNRTSRSSSARSTKSSCLPMRATIPYGERGSLSVGQGVALQVGDGGLATVAVDLDLDRAGPVCED